MAKVYKDYSKAVIADINRKMDNAMQKVGIMITTEAMANTPVDTGNLRANNAYKTSAGRGNLAVPIITNIAGKIMDLLSRLISGVNKAYVYIGNRVDYAKKVHFGTSKMPARPWLWNAIVAKKGNVDAIIKAELGIDDTQ